MPMTPETQVIFEMQHGAAIERLLARIRDNRWDIVHWLNSAAYDQQDRLSVLVRDRAKHWSRPAGVVIAFKPSGLNGVRYESTTPVESYCVVLVYDAERALRLKQRGWVLV